MINKGKMAMENELTQNNIVEKLKSVGVTKENLEEHLEEKFGQRYIIAREFNTRPRQEDKKEKSKKNRFDNLKDIFEEAPHEPEKMSDDELIDRFVSQEDNNYNISNELYLRMTKMSESDYIRMANLLDEQSVRLSSFDIFLSHAFADKYLVYGAYLILSEDLKFKVYIDWIIDPFLAPKRDKGAIRNIRWIQLRMRMSKCLQLLKTDNYSASKWIAWETGYMDAKTNKVFLTDVDDVEIDELKNGTGFLKIYPKLVQQDLDMYYWKNRYWNSLRNLLNRW